MNNELVSMSQEFIRLACPEALPTYNSLIQTFRAFLRNSNHIAYYSPCPTFVQPVRDNQIVFVPFLQSWERDYLYRLGLGEVKYF